MRMKDADLIQLIDKYFEGNTTLEEERLLRLALDETSSADPRVEEARAVMAYTAVASLQSINEKGRIADDRNEAVSPNVEPPEKVNPIAVGGLNEKGSRKRSVNVVRRWMWQAAAVAAVLFIGVSVTIAVKSTETGYHTMIACVEDSSKDVAFDLISSQLQAVGEASEIIEEDVQGSLNLMLDFETD